VGYEALAWGRHVHDHRDAWEIVRRADHPNVGLIVDSFHTLSRKIDPETIRRIPGDRIFFVQLADAPAIEMDLLYLSRHFRNMPGEGDLNVTGFMRAVQATGYGGPISLEIFNDQFRAGLPRLVARDGHRALIDLMDRVHRAEPNLPMVQPALPAPTPVQGVGFIEFATSHAEVADLESLLAATGFEHKGQHVSKSVRLWQQGAINLLVNTETTGFAHSAYVTHGTTVSDIALIMPNAQATHTRARALLAEGHDQTVAEGELAIPAIRGVGGSMVRFLDADSTAHSIWQTDFHHPPAPAPMGAGLTRVDHIAQTMAYDEMLSWALFYTAIFDASKAPMVDVADPDGLVRSQAVESGALRVTLNGAETRRTLAGRFIADSFGSAVQHIALASDDIFATAAALAQRGFPVLKIGQNYYDDVEARFGLDPTFTAQLRAANILYDQDPGGAYFQIYSQARPEGFFFEIVQRTGQYAGYGAANAPFRIAAQKRASRPSGMPQL